MKSYLSPVSIRFLVVPQIQYLYYRLYMWRISPLRAHCCWLETTFSNYLIVFLNYFFWVQYFLIHFWAISFWFDQLIYIYIGFAFFASFSDSLYLILWFSENLVVSVHCSCINVFFCPSDVLLNYRCNYKLLPRIKKVPLPCIRCWLCTWNKIIFQGHS